MTPPESVAPIFGASEALATGMTRNQIRQMVRSGRWTRVRKGLYVSANALGSDALDPYLSARLQHAVRAIAAASANSMSVVACESAAVIHHIPLWDSLPAEVCLIPRPGGWTGRKSGIVFRAFSLLPHHVMHASVRVTTPARTWVDLARLGSLAQALVAGDHSLRAGLFTVSEVDRVLVEMPRARGFRRARQALEHLDARRESPLESASAAYFVHQRIPSPTPQEVFYDANGRFIGRADFWWEDANLIGECDGRSKYRTPDDLYAEKRREDRLRAQGYAVIRWNAADLRTEALAGRLRLVLT